MTNLAILEAIERAQLIVAVDNFRLAGDPFKLSAPMKTLVTSRLADLVAKSAAATFAEGDRASATQRVRDALTLAELALRYTHRGIEALLPMAIPAAEGAMPHISEPDRALLFERFGFASGVIGGLNDARVEEMARNFATAMSQPVGETGWLPSGELASVLATQVTVIDANQPLATGGSRQVAIAARDAAHGLLGDINSRVRATYIAASDEGDRTAELARIGYTPRHEPGSETPLPGGTGAATADLANKTLTIAQLPLHATTIRALVKIDGGEEQVAGTSVTPEVSLLGLLTYPPGASVEAWVVGHNSAGDGPASNHVTFVFA